MFSNKKIDKKRLKDTINAFRIDYAQIMGVSDAKRLSGDIQGHSVSGQVANVMPTAWLNDLLPKNIAQMVGSSPEKVAFLLASKELDQDEKKAIASFFNVNEETCQRRLLIFERLINEYFPDLGQKAFLIKDDPHFQLLMELISPFNAYRTAKSHIQEQRKIKEYSNSKGVEL